MDYSLDTFKRLKILKTVYWHKRPFMLIHRITIRCNCRCQLCDWWKAKGYEQSRELDADTLGKIYLEATALGMTDYMIYGGEPLLRSDFPRVLASAKGAGLITSTTTNGLLLEERAHEIAPHLDYCVVSIDAIGDEHDRMRGVPGAFDRAVRGLEAVKRTGYPVRLRLWTQISRRNHHALTEVTKLARDLGAEIEFVPTWIIKGYNEKLVLPPEQRDEPINALKELKKRGYPIVNLYSSLRVMKTGESFQCNLPRLAVSFDWDGSVLPCVKKIDEPLGWFPALGTARIADLVSDQRFHDMADRLKSCNECNVACAMATKNNLFTAKIQHLMEMIYTHYLGRSTGRVG